MVKETDDEGFFFSPREKNSSSATRDGDEDADEQVASTLIDKIETHAAAALEQTCRTVREKRTRALPVGPLEGCL